MSSSDFSEYSVDEPSFDEAKTRNEALIKRLRAAGSSAEALQVISEWDALFCQYKEWSSLTYIRFSQDTKNQDYAAAKERLDSVSPMFTDLEVQMKNEILASPIRGEFGRELPPQLFDLWQCQANAFSPEIEDDLTEELRLESRHTALTAGAEILFRGETHNLSGIGKYFEDGDRDTRRGAYVARSRWFADHAEELDAIYGDQVRVRDAMAKKLGFPNFVGMAYQRRTRIGLPPPAIDLGHGMFENRAGWLAHRSMPQPPTPIGMVAAGKFLIALQPPRKGTSIESFPHVGTHLHLDRTQPGEYAKRSRAGDLRCQDLEPAGGAGAQTHLSSRQGSSSCA